MTHQALTPFAPGQLMILLHMHTTPNPLDELFPHTEWRDETVAMLAHNEMIQCESGVWSTTARGDAYVKAACNLPLPECVWIIPEEGVCAWTQKDHEAILDRPRVVEP